MASKAEIGIFGGSGFYSFLEDIDEIEIDTPYGKTSSKIAIGDIGGRKIAFLPRHGAKHQFPPHVINYRANVWAMKELGVGRIIAPSASGSLQPHIKPGDFVICDQFIDRTKGRIDTFYDGPVSTHISSAQPYCPQMRKIAYETAKELEFNVKEEGTVVVIQGPRFSSKAESRWFSKNGWEVVNMTQYPENILARELEICYLNISIITDYDVGLEDMPDIKPVSAEEVIKCFNENLKKIRELIIAMIPKLPSERDAVCSKSLETARLS